MISGRSTTVELMHRVIEEHGAEPTNWLPAFYEAVTGAGTGASRRLQPIRLTEVSHESLKALSRAVGDCSVGLV